MNPIIAPSCTLKSIARWEIRGLDDLTTEQTARLQHKVEGWIRQRGPRAGSRRRPFVTKPRTSYPA